MRAEGGLPQSRVRQQGGVLLRLGQVPGQLPAVAVQFLLREDGVHDRVGQQLETGVEVGGEEGRAHGGDVARRRRAERAAHPVHVGRQHVGRARAGPGAKQLRDGRGHAGRAGRLLGRPGGDDELHLDERQAVVGEDGDAQAVGERALHGDRHAERRRAGRERGDGHEDHGCEDCRREDAGGRGHGQRPPCEDGWPGRGIAPPAGTGTSGRVVEIHSTLRPAGTITRAAARCRSAAVNPRTRS